MIVYLTEYLVSDCKKVTLKEFSLKAWNKYLRLVTPMLLMALKEIQVYLSRSFIAFQHKRFEKKISSKSNLDALTTWFFFALDQTLFNPFRAGINSPKMISQKYWSFPLSSWYQSPNFNAILKNLDFCIEEIFSNCWIALHFVTYPRALCRMIKPVPNLCHTTLAIHQFTQIISKHFLISKKEVSFFVPFCLPR